MHRIYPILHQILIEMEKLIKNNDFNALKSLEGISKKAKGSTLSDEFYKSIKSESKGICKFLDCNIQQCAMFSVIVHLSFNNEDAQLGSICDYVECSPYFLLSHMRDFEVLIEKGYIYKSYRNKRSRKVSSELEVVYTIDDKIINCIIDSKIGSKQTNQKLNPVDFLLEVNLLVESREDNDEPHTELMRNIRKLADSNPDCLPVKITKQLLFSPEEEVFAYIICYATIDCDEISLNSLLNKVFDNERKKVRFKRYIMSEQSKLSKYEFVKFVSSSMRTDRDMSMTEKGLDYFLGEEKNIFFSDNGKLEDKEMMYPEKILSKQMYYNTSVAQQIDELTSMLKDESYKNIKERLKENNMTTAFTVLFHGYPGTGKTETVLQIARETGRAIYMIDVTKFKTCWFGESEKNLKKLFDKYRNKVKNSTIEPILLFNEADAIFSKRKDVNSSNVAQTENAIQNIILQEMETLDGILIATTNLTQNFDEAFERRFLYKICFDKPEIDIALQICKTRFPDIDEQSLKSLIQKYQFTGGQIENIARKYNMTLILKGVKPDIIQLEQYCKEETLHNQQRKSLGFCFN